MQNNKNIFITVAGSTPQIITESLYDLMIQQKINISEVHVITTLHGADKYEHDLLDYPDGQYYTFCRDYALKPTDINFEKHVIPGSNGEALYDIRTREENNAAADYIDTIVKNLCGREDTTIYASFSGGRKSMSVYMAYAMQLHARRRDKLFHVLVSPPQLEFNRNFYFPPPDNADIDIETKEGPKTIPGSEIKLVNTEIPFVRLRPFLDFDEGLELDNYTDLVKLTQKKLDEGYKPLLVFDDENKKVFVKLGETKWDVHLKPAELAIYHYLYKRKIIHNSDEQNNVHETELKKYYDVIRPGADEFPDFSRQAIGDARSKINGKLKETIKNKYVLKFVEIRSKQTKPYPIYELDPEER